MANDAIFSLVKHLRADATLLALFPTITAEPDADTYPQLYIESTSGPVNETPGTATSAYKFWAVAATRVECVDGQNRLRQLFGGKRGYTIGAGGVTVYCVASERSSNAVYGKRSDNGAWESRATYEFHIVEPHGFS